MSEIDTNSQEFKDAVRAAAAEETNGLKAKNTELMGKLKKAQAGATIDPADLQAVETERDTLKQQLADANRALKKATTDVEAATKRAGDIDAAYNRTLTDAALSEALGKAGVTNPALVKAAKALHSSAVQVVAEGDARVVKAGDKPLVDFITEWAGSDEGKHFVQAAPAAGSGAHTSRATNPTPRGDMGGSRDERTAAISARFNLPKE